MMMSRPNPATRHADNMIALELIVAAPAVPAKRYPLPGFALYVAGWADGYEDGEMVLEWLEAALAAQWDDEEDSP